jgi:alkanesulfonate monooxygenase SsuD/methylene tetrahydromethanopterin reductase-like flavin-dependent oxidoreductase (luciferase family)
MAEKHRWSTTAMNTECGEWKHPLIGAEDTARVDRFEEMSRDRFVVGGPATVISQLRRFVDALGIDHLIFRLYFPGMPHDFILRELNLLAREVLPALRGARA